MRAASSAGAGEVAEAPAPTLRVELSAAPPAAPEAHPSAQTPPLVGTQVGSYLIVGELGRGGMGVVYRAEHVVIGRPAAVKVLLPEYARVPALARRFVDEARAAARISHPGIVQVYDLGATADGRPCIVMEYLDGVTLEHHAAGRKLPADEALGILIDLAEVLGAAHAQGIAHRDVKPDNVLLLQTLGGPRLKLLDFGIARLDLLAPGATTPGTVVGTPWFMAPEQIVGGKITPAVDVYAAGVVAFRLLTGRLPFDGESLTHVLTQHLHTPVPSAPELGGALGDVVRRALAKTPEDRFANGEALAEALRTVRAELGRPAQGPQVVLDGSVLRVRYPTVEQLRRVHSEEIVKGRLFLPVGPTAAKIPDRPFHLVVDALGCTPLEYQAEAVYRTEAAAGAVKGMPSGVGLTLRRPAAPSRGTTVPREHLDRMLADLERRSDADPYAWLGVRPDAPMSDVKAAVRARAAVLDDAYPAASDAHRERITVLRSKLNRVRGILEVPAQRAAFDARVGNFRGVARCITGGLTNDTLDELRATFEAAYPERLRRAAAEELSANVLERAGRLSEALAALEQALASDPLSLALQRRYWALKHRVGGAPAVRPG